MKRIIFALLFVLMSAPLLAAPEDKVDICHFDADGGFWELINISENALETHLANHDDAFPEQTTGVTGTYLDANCQDQPTLPDCGNCLVDQGEGNKGCEVQTCEDYVCVLDAFCCSDEWDGLCVYKAEFYCQGNFCN